MLKKIIRKAIPAFIVIAICCLYLISTKIVYAISPGPSIKKPISASLDSYNIIDNNNELWSWVGTDSYYIHANLKDNSSLEPSMLGFSDAASVETIEGMTFILKKDGTVWETKEEFYMPQNANDTSINNSCKVKPSVPKKIDGLDNISSISAGPSYLLCLKDDGTVWSLQLASNHAIGDYYGKPVKVDGLTDVKSVYSDCDTFLALKNDGTFWRWGYVEDSPFVNVQENSQPIKLNGFEKIKYFSVDDSNGIDMIIGIDDSGNVWFYGNLKSYWFRPVCLKQFKGAVQFSGRYFLKKDGTVWDWWNLGFVNIESHVNYPDGSYAINPDHPKKVKGLSDIVCLDSDGLTYMAVDKSGKLTTWDCKTDYRVNDDDESNNENGIQNITIDDMPYYRTYDNIKVNLSLNESK